MEENTYFSGICNVDKIASEHPEYTQVFVCVEEIPGKTILKLSKGHGDFLLLVSSVNHEDMKSYFSRKTFGATEKRLQPEGPELAVVPSKKAKQQTLLGFFKKPS